MTDKKPSSETQKLAVRWRDRRWHPAIGRLELDAANDTAIDRIAIEQQGEGRLTVTRYKYLTAEKPVDDWFRPGIETEPDHPFQFSQPIQFDRNQDNRS